MLVHMPGSMGNHCPPMAPIAPIASCVIRLSLASLPLLFVVHDINDAAEFARIRWKHAE